MNATDTHLRPDRELKRVRTRRGEKRPGADRGGGGKPSACKSLSTPLKRGIGREQRARRSPGRVRLGRALSTEPPAGAPTEPRPQALRAPGSPPRSLPDSGVGPIGPKVRLLPAAATPALAGEAGGTRRHSRNRNHWQQRRENKPAPRAGRAVPLRACDRAGRRAHQRGTWAPQSRPWTQAQLKKGTDEEGQAHYRCQPQGDPTWCQAEVQVGRSEPPALGAACPQSQPA